MNNKDIKILIVDDTPTNIQVVASILDPSGYQLSFARNGISALKMTKTKDFDLILLDIMMPGMDGYEVCEQLKTNETTKNIPIIFLTAKTDADSIIKAFSMGAVDYVTKPFNGHELLARVNNQVNLMISQKQLSQANKKLRNILKTKDKLFSIIGHDLRGPIGSYQSLLELIEQQTAKLKDESLNKVLKLGIQSTGATLNLLENLLYWAKSEQGETQFKPKEVSINKIIDSTIFLLNATAVNKNIKFILKIEDDLHVFGDKNMLKTIFRNLTSNALKFSYPDSRIVISAERLNEQIKCMIKDQGVGIPKENIDKLFENTEHVTTFGTQNEKGSGLGLMLCKNFIDKHNGSIWVESSQGKGSSFFFTLPVSSMEDILIG